MAKADSASGKWQAHAEEQAALAEASGAADTKVTLVLNPKPAFLGPVPRFDSGP